MEKPQSFSVIGSSAGLHDRTGHRWRRHRGKIPHRLWAIFVLYLSVICGTLMLRIVNGEFNEYSGAIGHGREKREITLLLKDDDKETENCTPRAIGNFPPNFFTLKDTQKGGVFIHILLSIYMFAALAVVCDDYFVPSLERICEDLKIHPDVAGATFMAMGSSGPELVTSLIGVFIAKSDVGVGTIVGSAVFNILFILGVCGLCAGMVIQLAWWPVIRDTVFYFFSVLCLILVIMDGAVHWYEAVVMTVLYTAYIVLMVYNTRLERWALSSGRRLYQWKYGQVPIAKGTADTDATQPLLTSQGAETAYSGSSSLRVPPDGVGEQHETSLADNSATSLPYPVENESARKMDADEEIGEVESPWDIPDSFLSRILWVSLVPVKALIYVTVPDCRVPRWRRFYMATFSLSLVWIVAFSYVMVWMVTIAGDALNIPDTVMGLTLLAAGTSVPDCLCSVFAARDGYGDMAMSNVIGSNVFDILVGLGLPWLLDTGMVNAGRTLTINSGGLTYSSITLLSTILILLAALIINRWRLTRRFGVVFLLVYLAVIGLSCMFELNIFGDVNPPSCSR